MPRFGSGQLAALLVLSGFGYLVGLMPVQPNDFWWHLRMGQIIASTGAIPHTNLFAWTLPLDAPFGYGGWLGEWLLYQLYTLGSVELTVFARNALIVATFGLMAWEARRRSGSWGLAALVTAIAGVMSLNNVGVRPQDFAWLPFMAFAIVLARVSAGQLSMRWLAVLPLALAVWANVHGTFILGFALLAGYFLGEALRQVGLPRKNRSSRLLQGLALVGLASTAATLLNPDGIGVYGFVRDLVATPSQALSIEGKPPSPNGPAAIAFYLSILALICVLAYARQGPRPADLVLVAGFLWLAWSGQRYVFWYALIAMPILAELIASAMPRRHPGRPPSPLYRLVAIVGLLPLILGQPWLIERLFSDTTSSNTRAAGQPLLDAETPVAAASYLVDHPGGNLFNELGYGSYLIWAVPEQLVFVDPRIYPFSVELLEDYVAVGEGHGSLELLERYGADRVLLSRKLQPKLAQVLGTASGWQREYADTGSEIWRRSPIG
ncbi:MAG: hypothetical protein QOF51_932 [Chloroflexota bacterium]|nr:hypothetical protein [Chloroflexota bacterium]